MYITLNKLPEEIAYRRYNRIDRMKGRDASTSDKDVERRTFLFIDADCERVAGISSTNEEKRKSRAKSTEPARLKLFWGVFNQASKRIAKYDFTQKKQADAKAAEAVRHQIANIPAGQRAHA